jgi:hypothetical protein
LLLSWPPPLPPSLPPPSPPLLLQSSPLPQLPPMLPLPPVPPPLLLLLQSSPLPPMLPLRPVSLPPMLLQGSPLPLLQGSPLPPPRPPLLLQGSPPHGHPMLLRPHVKALLVLHHLIVDGCVDEEVLVVVRHHRIIAQLRVGGALLRLTQHCSDVLYALHPGVVLLSHQAVIHAQRLQNDTTGQCRVSDHDLR